MSGPCALAVEAATGQLSLAACRGARVEVLELQPAREHTDRIYEHAAAVLAAVGADFGALDCVAFGCGPGSFTGVRVAAAVAQALAFARDLPVVRISSLAVLAAGAARVHGSANYGICEDARMGQAYAGLYQGGPMPVALMPDALVEPSGLEFPGVTPFIALGDGWAAFPELHERHRSRLVALDTALLPSARELLSMALEEFRAGRTLRAEQALPEYLGQAPAHAPGQGNR